MTATYTPRHARRRPRWLFAARCLMCNRWFWTFRGFHAHWQKESAKHRCPICTLWFTSGLEDHLRRDHGQPARRRTS